LRTLLTLAAIGWCIAAYSDDVIWNNIQNYPKDIVTTTDAWTASRENDPNFTSYRCAADDFFLEQTTKLTQLRFYSVEVNGPVILGGDWYLYAGDKEPDKLLAFGAGLKMQHDDSGLINQNFGTVFRNTLLFGEVTLDPGRYFLAFRSFQSFAQSGGKHAILTTRWANADTRALWNFALYTDGTIGDRWYRMDEFNGVKDQEWAFELEGTVVPEPSEFAAMLILFGAAIRRTFSARGGPIQVT
jgi:hypothetical protein